MKERPEKILKAIEAGDLEYLGHAGRKGGLATARKRDIEHAKQELAEEIKKLEEWQRQLSTNEHIIDADGNDHDYIDED